MPFFPPQNSVITALGSHTSCPLNQIGASSVHPQIEDFRMDLSPVGMQHAGNPLLDSFFADS
jgi:hypothetical protein